MTNDERSIAMRELLYCGLLTALVFGCKECPKSKAEPKKIQPQVEIQPKLKPKNWVEFTCTDQRHNFTRDYSELLVTYKGPSHTHGVGDKVLHAVTHQAGLVVDLLWLPKYGWLGSPIRPVYAVSFGPGLTSYCELVEVEPWSEKRARAVAAAPTPIAKQSLYKRKHSTGTVEMYDWIMAPMNPWYHWTCPAAPVNPMNYWDPRSPASDHFGFGVGIWDED